MNSKILYLMFSAILISNVYCQSERDLYLNHKQNVFNTQKTLFNDSLLVHFPLEFDTTDLNHLNINSSYKNQPREILYLAVVKKMTVRDSINIAKFKKMSEFFYITSPCLITVYNDYNGYGFDKTILGRETCDEFIPVPACEMFVLKEYPSDLIFYIFKKQKGIFYDYEDIYSRYYLPIEWKNGLSCGFAISHREKKIFYWSMIW